MLDLDEVEAELARRTPEFLVGAGHVPGNGKEEAWIRFVDWAHGSSALYIVTRDNYDGDMKVLSAQRVRADLCNAEH